MKLKDTPNFDRDISSKAIVSNNRAALEELRSKREMNSRLLQLETSQKQIEQSLNNITNILTKLLENHG